METKVQLGADDRQAAIALVAALATPAKIATPEDLVSALQDVMTALAERGGLAGIAIAALEIARERRRQ